MWCSAEAGRRKGFQVPSTLLLPMQRQRVQCRRGIRSGEPGILSNMDRTWWFPTRSRRALCGGRCPFVMVRGYGLNKYEVVKYLRTGVGVGKGFSGCSKFDLGEWGAW